MPRTARLQYPGGVFHVVSRCIEGQYLLDQVELRSTYVALLGRAAQRTDARVLAYCVMSNHTHVVAVQGQEPLSRLFKPLNTGMAWHVNRHRKGRGAKGPVFAQRPRTLLVDEEAYLLELVRYVHNNPVRAGVVDRAVQSSWSSHRAYVDHAECPSWLHAGYVLQRFGPTRARAVKAFELFVREGAREQRRQEFSGESSVAAQKAAVRLLGDGYRVSDGVLGDDAFVARVTRDVCAVEHALAGGTLRRRLDEPKAPQACIEWVAEAVCDLLSLDRHELDVSTRWQKHVLARRLLTWTWVSRFGGRQIEVARELRATTSAVARWYSAAFELQSELEALTDEVVRRVRLGPKSGAAGMPKTRVRFEIAVEA